MRIVPVVLTPLLSALLPGGDLWIWEHHSLHSGQWRDLSDHRRARPECRGGAKHSESHALVWHVRLLWSDGFSCEWPPEAGCTPLHHLTAALLMFMCWPGGNLALMSQVGLPAKSGVSGAILLVIPNVMGVMCWSPPLDRVGNSVRGIHFCQARAPFTLSSVSVHSATRWSQSGLWEFRLKPLISPRCKTSSFSTEKWT